MKMVAIVLKFVVLYICLHLLFVFLFLLAKKFTQKVGGTPKAPLQSLS